MTIPKIKVPLKLIFFLCFTSLFTFCSKAQSGSDSAKLALSLVGNLAEVKAYFHRADSLYHSNKIKAQIIVLAEPAKEAPYYWLQVGINDGDRLTPEYNFYVYLNKKEVKYYDTMTEGVLTLNEWRKRKR